ncbi:thermostable carboxypeptidase 2 [Clostridium paraputrificum]|nr:thermostable carboxypeptidase 2 [Clostridium paraputrificum]
MNKIMSQAKLIYDDLITIRRTIHSNPEVGSKLPKQKLM